MRWRVLGLCVALLALSQSTAAEVQSRSKWWLSSEVQQELQLSTDAVARIDDIFESVIPILRSGWRDFNRLEQAFEALLEKDDVTEAEVAHELEHLEAARAELRKTRTLMLFRMRRVLTAEQRGMLEAYTERRREERRSRDDRSGDDWRRR